MLITNFVQLDRNDSKATSLIRNSLEVTASVRTLSRKMLNRLRDTPRQLIAIFESGIDLELLASYESCWPIPDDDSFQYEGATEGRTTERLVRFIADYLESSSEAVVVSEDWMKTRADIPKLGVPPPHISCLGDGEVYYLLTPEIKDPELIEDSVAPCARFQTGVCSTSVNIPMGDMQDNAFLEEVAVNARHIFVPAFDGSGYLIWSLA
jgi:hypothetical protein